MCCRVTHVLGYLPQEMTGSSIYEYLHKDSTEAFSELQRQGEAQIRVVIHLSDHSTQYSFIGQIIVVIHWLDHISQSFIGQIRVGNHWSDHSSHSLALANTDYVSHNFVPSKLLHGHFFQKHFLLISKEKLDASEYLLIY